MLKKSLSFNDIEHTVTYKDHVLSLNPLSFKLLKVLADANEETVSINTIASQVWQNSAVSPETLKQRVFVLRKSITESGIDGLVIRSIRGEGYRLIIEDDLNNLRPQEISRNHDYLNFFKTHKNAARIIIALLFITISAVVFLKAHSKHNYINNRIALWTNVDQQQLPKSTARIYTIWHQKLSHEMAKGKINLILSNRQKDMLVPIQARKNRIALISYFEVITQNQKIIVNLSIVEPKTATILRTDSLEVLPNLNAENVLESHLKGMLELISSGKLNLSKQHKNNSKDPIWLHLKQLANPK